MALIDFVTVDSSSPMVSTRKRDTIGVKFWYETQNRSKCRVVALLTYEVMSSLKSRLTEGGKSILNLKLFRLLAFLGTAQ